MDSVIAGYIDHTLLKPSGTLDAFRTLCSEAVEYRFAAVCVPPHVIGELMPILAGSSVRMATVIGFPMGYSSIAAKLTEIDGALRDGAEELDVVINGIALKNGQWAFLEKEMSQLVSRIHDAGKLIKVIVESGNLTKEEIIQCCNLYAPMHIDFMKTSTGYSEQGATVEAVKVMRAHLPASVQIKASGGIKTYTAAREMIDAGATRIGSSGGVAIVQQEKQYLK